MNPDTVSHILSFCGNAYLYVATVNKMWRHAYDPTTNTNTSINQAVTSLSRVRSALPTLQTHRSLNNAAFFHASKLGNVSVLSLLIDNKRPAALYACTSGAVAGGSLPTLSWAVANGFPLDRFVCHHAASAGNLGMLKWAVNNGCPWDPASCADAARQNGHGGGVGYFLDNYVAI